jgi:hypothetical protein
VIAQPELFQLDPPVPVEPDDAPACTERHMLDLLHNRYTTDHGNGSRYACAEHVRNAAGFDANRTADFIAMDLWPSKGLHLHGHEVKVSRSDWLRELADPRKAAAFTRYMDYWWLAVPNDKIVRDDLPLGWGLMIQRGSRLYAVIQAARLSPEPIPRSFMASLMRATSVTAERRTARRMTVDPTRRST